MNPSTATRRTLTSAILAATLFVSQKTGAQESQPIPIPDYARDGKPSGLPLPSSMPLGDYEEQLYEFLFERKYTELGWAVDREVRDTGPFILGANYGTHLAVRIYYSPDVLNWLVNHREGAIPDGAMIIKEMYAPPAARYMELKNKVNAQHPNDAAKAERVYEATLQGFLSSWTVLVKDKSLTTDGWFWANPAPGTAPDTYDYPFNFPASGAGLGTCLRCHASAEKEVTFSSLSNIKGFEAYGDPLRFRVDNSWRTELPSLQRPAAGRTEADLLTLSYPHMPESTRGQTQLSSSALPGPNAAFLSTFSPMRTDSDGKTVRLLQPAEDRVQSLPGQWADHVPAGPGGAEQFITSDNCLGCHGGLGGAPFGVTMFVKTGPNYGDGYNVSEFGEWRWSPMGLAGRDPIFFSQLESELAMLSNDAKSGLFPEEDLRSYQQAVANTCLSCHGAMGQRQLEIDQRNGKPEIDDPNFYYPDYLMLTEPLSRQQAERQRATLVDGLDGKHSVYPYRKYGALAREGISCAVCHHINPPDGWTGSPTKRNRELADFLMSSTTGVFPYSPRNELNGPFADVKTLPMENALGIVPKQNPYIRDSKMCGACHTINLPNVDAPTDKPLQGLTAADQIKLNQAAKNGAEGPNAVPLSTLLTGFQHSIEQATYLEWENSDFAWDPTTFQSCQDCHMPGGLHSLDGEVRIDQLATQIASIEDSTYPDADNRLPDSETDIPVRNDYRRHELLGLNVFLLEMFNQFDTILGVNRSDYMTGATNGNPFAMENMLRQARRDTVDVQVSITAVDSSTIEADVNVTNKVGHRFPSGVGFRRAFLEVLVLRKTDAGETVVWGSGQTSSVGVIVDGDGEPLETEFLDKKPAGKTMALYQPHHQTIDSEDQVQIYEELVLDAKGEFTTSFIHRDEHPKDNRLLPFGFIHPRDDAFKKRFGNDATLEAFMKATVPEGRAEEDPNFGPGKDTVKYRMSLPKGLEARKLTVKATMYYQAFPPYWLHQRFSLAPDQPGTQRLYYLTSHLNTEGTPIENWKLPLVSATASVEKFLSN